MHRHDTSCTCSVGLKPSAPGRDSLRILLEHWHRPFHACTAAARDTFLPKRLLLWVSPCIGSEEATIKKTTMSHDFSRCKMASRKDHRLRCFMAPTIQNQLAPIFQSFVESCYSFFPHRRPSFPSVVYSPKLPTLDCCYTFAALLLRCAGEISKKQACLRNEVTHYQEGNVAAAEALCIIQGEGERQPRFHLL